MTFEVLSPEAVQAKLVTVEHKPSGTAIEIAEQAAQSAPPGHLVEEPPPWYTREGARGLPVDERFIVDDEAT